MPRNRHTFRSVSRSTIRSATRTAIRVRWRAPDDLGTAIACFRRAIAAHRRLARLAPRFFDSAVIERERQEHEAQRRWMESWEAALAKIYGPAHQPSKLLSAAPQSPPTSPRTVAAVQRQLASWTFWFTAGSEAQRRFQLRHPHAVVSLNRVVHLIEIGVEFGRLAVGLDSIPS
jgi:hypothetical protein